MLIKAGMNLEIRGDSDILMDFERERIWVMERDWEEVRKNIKGVKDVRKWKKGEKRKRGLKWNELAIDNPFIYKVGRFLIPAGKLERGLTRALSNADASKKTGKVHLGQPFKEGRLQKLSANYGIFILFPSIEGNIWQGISFYREKGIPFILAGIIEKELHQEYEVYLHFHRFPEEKHLFQDIHSMLSSFEKEILHLFSGKMKKIEKAEKAEKVEEKKNTSFISKVLPLGERGYFSQGVFTSYQIRGEFVRDFLTCRKAVLQGKEREVGDRYFTRVWWKLAGIGGDYTGFNLNKLMSGIISSFSSEIAERRDFEGRVFKLPEDLAFSMRGTFTKFLFPIEKSFGILLFAKNFMSFWARGRGKRTVFIDTLFPDDVKNVEDPSICIMIQKLTDKFPEGYFLLKEKEGKVFLFTKKKKLVFWKEDTLVGLRDAVCISLPQEILLKGKDEVIAFARNCLLQVK